MKHNMTVWTKEEHREAFDLLAEKSPLLMCDLGIMWGDIGDNETYDCIDEANIVQTNPRWKDIWL